MNLLWKLRFSCLIQILSVGIFNTFETLHMRNNGLSEGLIGVMLAVENILIMGGAVLWGWIADQFRCYRLLIILGTLGLTLNLAWFAFAQTEGSFWVYAVFRGILVPTLMGVMPALAVHNMRHLPGGSSFGNYRAYGSVGFVIGSWVFPYFFSGIKEIALMGALILPASIYLIRSLEEPGDHQNHLTRKRIRLRDLPSNLKWLYFAFFLNSFSEPGVHGFLGAYAKSLGAGVQWVGILAGFTGLMALIGLPIMGKWVDRVGPRRILFWGFAAQAVRMVMTACITSTPLLLIPHTLHFFGWAGREVAMVVYVNRLIGDDNRATGLSMMMSMRMFGMTVSSFIMGYLIEAIGYQQMFLIIGAITAVSLYALHRVSETVQKD
jgi:MFS family permease